jgi:hypothetical protein
MQQGWVLPPQLPQVPPAAQVPAPLQDWARAIHCEVLLVVRVQQPAAQRLPGQHGPLASPHLWQIAVELPGVVEHTVSGSVHACVEDEQQALPSLPQTQVPLVQVPLEKEQAAPLATQRPLVQQPPSRHVLPAQQGPLARPHTVQMLLLMSHTPSASLHLEPAQHGLPLTPHFWHCCVLVPGTVAQTRSGVLQRLLKLASGQQGCPALPHSHWPERQVP